MPPGSLTTAHMPSRTACMLALRQAHRRPVLGLGARLQHAVDRARQMRLHRAAGGDARHHRGQRQRRELEVALADAADDGVADVPRLALRDAPVARRHQALARARQLDVELDAEAEAVRHRGDVVDAGAPRRLEEEHVAAVLQAAVQIERAVAVLAPAMEPPVAEIEVAGAVDPVVRASSPWPPARPAPPPS